MSNIVQCPRCDYRGLGRAQLRFQHQFRSMRRIQDEWLKGFSHARKLDLRQKLNAAAKRCDWPELEKYLTWAKGGASRLSSQDRVAILEEVFRSPPEVYVFYVSRSQLEEAGKGGGAAVEYNAVLAAPDGSRIDRSEIEGVSATDTAIVEPRAA